jgi:hypothetical protein
VNTTAKIIAIGLVCLVLVGVGFFLFQKKSEPVSVSYYDRFMLRTSQLINSNNQTAGSIYRDYLEIKNEIIQTDKLNAQEKERIIQELDLKYNQVIVIYFRNAIYAIKQDNTLYPIEKQAKFLELQDQFKKEYKSIGKNEDEIEQLKQQLKEELKLIKLDLTWGKRFSKIKEAIETYLKDRAYDPLRQEFCESEFSDITFNGIQYLDSSIFSPAETPRKIDYSIRFFSQFNITYSCPLDIGNSVETKTVDEKKEIHCIMDDAGKISITIDEQNF